MEIKYTRDGEKWGFEVTGIEIDPDLVIFAYENALHAVNFREGGVAFERREFDARVMGKGFPSKCAAEEVAEAAYNAAAAAREEMAFEDETE